MTQAYFRVDRAAPRGPYLLEIPTQETVAELWAIRRGLRTELRRATAMRDAAIARMPAWAAPGPKYIDTRGRRVGETVHWPEIRGVKPPEILGAVRQLRPSPYELRRNTMHGLAGPQVGLANYRAALRLLAERRRAQRIEEDRVGLFEREAALREAENRVDTVSEAIIGHAEHSFDAVAAKILIGAQYEQMHSSPADMALENVLSALRAARPGLTGLIAADVDEIFSKPNVPIGELRFYAF